MKKEICVSCPMDCPDLCRFVVQVENKKIIGLKGDKGHPVTRGVVCKKGRDLVERCYHPQRILHPLIRKNNEFLKISYDEVIKIIAEQLSSIKQLFGSTAIVNYTSDGYGGIKNRIQSIFFNCFGGVTVPKGSLCWGAGIAAQKYDFGNARGHFPDDVLNAELILVWGRNPKSTNFHLYSQLKKAQKKGRKVIVIDPVRTATAKAFNSYVRIVPSTDAALALAMANVIIEKKLYDKAFVGKYVLGFERFKTHIKEFTLERASAVTGIPKGEIEKLAVSYATSKTACIYVGYGMQRYHNSGNAVRAIDALGAIVGKVGKKGCGVNYAAKSISPYVNGVEKETEKHIHLSRAFTFGRLGAFLDRAQDPPVKAIFVASGNPLTQSPDLQKTIQAFLKIPFKVVFDHFLTDTARHADIILPAASVFEQDDVFVTSMYSPVLNYSQKVIDSPKGVMPEFDFYLKLAKKMGIQTLGFDSSKAFLEQSVQPLLTKMDISFDYLKNSDHHLCLKENDIAWKSGVFETPSKKIEIFSEKAQARGLFPLPSFIEPKKGSELFPLRLLTCHAKESLHSQGFAFMNELPVVYLNKKMAKKCESQDEDRVLVIGENAQLKAVLSVTEDIGDNTAFMYQGFWHKSGAVNLLTDSVISDMGQQAAYYDSFCRVVKIT